MFNRKVCAEFWLKRAETGAKKSDLGISQTCHQQDLRLRLSCCQQSSRISGSFSRWNGRAACSWYKGLRPVSASSSRSCASTYGRWFSWWYRRLSPTLPARLFHLKNRRILKIRLILWKKSGKFAHSDAEAPLSVFLFHRYFPFKTQTKLDNSLIINFSFISLCQDVKRK